MTATQHRATEPPPIFFSRRRQQAIRRLERIESVLTGRRKLLIISHNNPDPDAIASMWGIKKMVEANGQRTTSLGYAGLLGRSENRALVRELNEPFLRIEDIVPGTFDALILVDCQPGAGNVTLPQDLLPTAVLDHHPRTPEIKGVPFVDIRESFGSCTALIYEYFRERGIEPDRLTATIFYYAIRSETQELGREASVHDRRLFRRLAHLVDWELLHRVVHAPVPRSYYVTFKVALDRARLYKDAMFADAGELPIPDAAAEIADWLLRLDEVKWALACGTYRGRLHFSLRSVVLGAHCGEISQKIVEGWGTAGGHGTMAGGQVKLSSTSYDRRAAIHELERRYIAVMGYKGVSPTEDPFAVVPGGLSRRQTKRVP